MCMSEELEEFAQRSLGSHLEKGMESMREIATANLQATERYAAIYQMTVLASTAEYTSNWHSR